MSRRKKNKPLPASKISIPEAIEAMKFLVDRYKETFSAVGDAVKMVTEKASEGLITLEWNSIMHTRWWGQFHLAVTVSRGTGIRCGYVSIPQNHSMYGLNIYDIKYDDLDVHGGVTFTGSHDTLSKLVFGKVTDVHWIGFDVGHYGDGHDLDCIDDPAMREIYRTMNDVDGGAPVRSLDWMVQETEYLASQLAKVRWIFGYEANHYSRNMGPEL